MSLSGSLRSRVGDAFMTLAVSTVIISYLFLVDPDSKYQSLPGWTRLLANMFTGTISHIATIH